MDLQVPAQAQLCIVSREINRFNQESQDLQEVLKSAQKLMPAFENNVDQLTSSVQKIKALEAQLSDFNERLKKTETFILQQEKISDIKQQKKPHIPQRLNALEKEVTFLKWVSSISGGALSLMLAYCLWIRVHKA